MLRCGVKVQRPINGLDIHDLVEAYTSNIHTSYGGFSSSLISLMFFFLSSLFKVAYF